MSGQLPVYEETESVLVPSGHDDNTHYRVFFGTVNWSRSPGDERRAVTVLMQYGSTQDWAAARDAGEIAFHLPAHVLVEDLPSVLAVMSRYGRQQTA